MVLFFRRNSKNINELKFSLTKITVQYYNIQRISTIFGIIYRYLKFIFEKLSSKLYLYILMVKENELCLIFKNKKMYIFLCKYVFTPWTKTIAITTLYSQPWHIYFDRKCYLININARNRCLLLNLFTVFRTIWKNNEKIAK